MTQGISAFDKLDRIQRPALIAGAVGLALCLLGLLISPAHEFFLAWLFAFLFWAGIPLGCLGLLMLQYLTGGIWGLVLRRLLEAGSRMIYPMFIAFIPMFFGLPFLYRWENLSKMQQVYLTVPFWIGRALLYFAIWIGLTFLLNLWSAQQDRDATVIRRFQWLSGPGIVLHCLAVTFAAVDWVMAIDPRWYSTIWGFILIMGQALAALALVTWLCIYFTKEGPLKGLGIPNNYQDIGNLLLACVMLWAYMAFSQLLIIWSGNIAEETPYYLYRVAGAWKIIAGLLIAVHFALPFFLLLHRRIKRDMTTLAMVAALILFMRLIDLFWMVIPMWPQARHIDPPPGFHIHWLDIAAPVGMGGIWIALFLRELKRRPLIPVNDPRLKEVATHGRIDTAGPLPPRTAPGAA